VKIVASSKLVGTDMYRVAESEDSTSWYEIQVVPKGGVFTVWAVTSSGREIPQDLSQIPIPLTPFILEALSRKEYGPSYEGPFRGEPGARYVHLVEAVEEAFHGGSRLGEYFLGVVATWYQPGDDEWDVAVYQRLALAGSPFLSPEELQFRVAQGRSFLQDDITRAILNLLGYEFGEGL